MGDTPLIDFPLKPGMHTLRLVNEELHVDRRIEVEIKPGQTTTLSLRL